jgi:hypothetical protein
MTRFQKAATIIALALCFAGAIGMEIWQSSGKSQPSASHLPSQSIATCNDQNASHDAKRDCIDKALADYTFWLVIVTLILAAATIGLGISTIFQLRLARAEFISTHRPIVRVRRVYLSAFAARFGADNISHGDDVEIELIVSNAGDTDAHIVDSRYRLYFFKTTAPEDDSLQGEYPRKIQ